MDAGAVGSWTDVNAVSIELTIQSADRRVTTDVAVNSGRLQRDFASIVTMRNRCRTSRLGLPHRSSTLPPGTVPGSSACIRRIPMTKT